MSMSLGCVHPTNAALLETHLTRVADQGVMDPRPYSWTVDGGSYWRTQTGSRRTKPETFPLAATTVVATSTIKKYAGGLGCKSVSDTSDISRFALRSAVPAVEFTVCTVFPLVSE